MSTSTEPHTDTVQFENQVSLPMLNYQEPQFSNHHGYSSTPQISVTKSSPDAQRKCVSNQLQVPSESECSTNDKEKVSNEEDKLINTIHYGQRGRMEDQCCDLDPSRSAPCSPHYTQRKPIRDLELENETFLNILANSQSQRLDDQRASLPSLPGLKKDTTSNPESSYLCYMVSKVQGSRMDDQRCSLPQIITGDVLSKDSLSTNGSERTRSASFCANVDIHPSKKKSIKKSLNPVDQDGFFNMISRVQQERMEDQRCELKVTPKSSRKKTPEKSPNDSEAFFNQLATSQSHRLDDQRVSLPSLPGIQNGEKKNNAAESDTNYLCYMVSKVQGSRMDEQRCSAPFIFQNMSPSFQRKDSGKTLQRSSSLNRSKNGKKEITVAQQEQFFKMMKHAQKGRMEEQRCSLPSSTPATPTHNGSALNNTDRGAETDAFVRSPARRLNNQHADPPVLPRTRGTSTEKRKAVYKEDTLPKKAPQITVTQSTPTTLKKEITRPLSVSQAEHVEPASVRSIPKSASYSQEASPAQLTVRVSMSFSSFQGLMNPDQPSNFPELFLTLGAPGDNLVIPLSPVPGRRLSLSLNLIPKEDVDTEQTPPNHPSSWKSHSGPPSPTVKMPSHSPSSPQDNSMLVAITQAVKGQTAPAGKGNRLKVKDKPNQDKGKKVIKKEKSGNKQKTG